MPAEASIVLGVHGPWGAGKSTLLGAIERELASALGNEKGIFIRFNAWKFQDRETLWRALILHVLAQIATCGGDPKQIDELQQSLYRAFSVEEKGPWTLNWHTVIVETIGIALAAVKLDFVAKAIRNSSGILGKILCGGESKEDKSKPLLEQERVEKLASVLERKTVERRVLQVESIEQLLADFQRLIKQLTDGDRRVFVFVDDLDRCLPESALQIFESIKLFMDAPGCCYVVALDRDVIRKGLAVRYARAGEASSGQP
jgi:predicted KAP-like P-loop ATPase